MVKDLKYMLNGSDESRHFCLFPDTAGEGEAFRLSIVSMM
jgi:hypothetical protein